MASTVALERERGVTYVQARGPILHVGEYILALVTIVLGLALADMAASVDRLVKKRDHLRLDTAALLATAMIFYAVVANLWAQYAHYKDVTTAKLSEGVVMIFTFMITYLMAAIVLPDDWEGELDLHDHYDQIRKPLWGLFGLNAIAVFVAHIVRSGQPAAANYISLCIGLAIAGILMAVGRRSLQIALLLGVIALQVFSLGDLRITG